MTFGARPPPFGVATPWTEPVPILLVDDTASERLALKAILSPLDCEIFETSSGEEALRCVMARTFAVILLDVHMPAMDGFETAALIRLRQQSEMTPIIFVTAHDVDELVTRDRYAQGAVDFMHAPVAPDELRAKVSAFANLYVEAAELARKARQVQVSADQLRLLTESAPIGIFQTDARNRYVYTNPHWSDLTGIPPAEAVGEAWDWIIDPARQAGSIFDEGPGRIDQGDISRRFAICPDGGAARIVQLTSKSMVDRDGLSAGWVGTLADVTSAVDAEIAMSEARDNANEASRQKSDFLANMSHEIRTPMNGVIGMADLLLETDLDSRQRDFAQTVRSSGAALLTIINDILDFSKVEAGRLEIEEIDFDLQDVVDDVVDLLAGAAQSHGLELTSIVDGGVPAVVNGDPGRVRQVLTNLIGNAIKFTPVGEVVVRVTMLAGVPAPTVARAGDGPASFVRFEVTDTGDGIAQDKLAVIFQAFAQADSSTSRRYGGTGLGLTISSQLVALMGGDCGVTSQVGEGSTFWFTIEAPAQGGPTQDDLVVMDPELVDATVLIVDDSGSQREVLTQYLNGFGMSVVAADSAAEGLATLRTAVTHERAIEVAVIDRAMPGMDGLALGRVIRTDPDLSTRVVLMTGLGQDCDAGDIAESGVAATLVKPVHREDVRIAVREALGLQPRQAAVASVTTPLPGTTPHAPIGRLLLAEDNLINQKIAVAMLSGAGYRVDTVADGARAVEAVASRADQPYDAILMDCHMPELNGYMATAAIRASEGTTRHTPIIAITAGADGADRERCLAEGMDSYLVKPVSKDALLARVAWSMRMWPAPVREGTP